MGRARVGAGGFSSRLGRVALAFTRLLPERLLANPERVLINVALIALGALVALPRRAPLGVVSGWPFWLQLEWGLGMVAGGCFALHGYWTGVRISERVGAAALALGSTLYATQALLGIGGSRGTVFAIIFYCIAAAKLIRLARSLAVAERIAQHLDRGDLDLPGGAGGPP